ncbi:hypothetical protein ES703_116269 [subsurface metagenome]
MATLYEYYNLPGNTFDSIRGNLWKGQTFTPSVGHRVTGIKIKARRYGFPGTITVSIKATLDGHPTGPDLCSGTTNGDTLTDESPGEWREISLGDGAILSAGQKYAIVIRALAGDGSNNLQWRLDSTSPTYVGGCKEFSSDGGITWFSYDGIEQSPSSDELFEEWGEPAVTTVPTITTNPASNIEPTTVTLNGILDDDGGEACDCGFEWGQDVPYGNTTPTESKTTGQTVSQPITGLQPKTTYRFRAFATNSAGTSYGTIRTFTTPARLPITTTNPATGTSTLNGTLDDDGGEACDCGFEWGETDAYGKTTPTQSRRTGQSVLQTIGELLPDTTYHFRAFATNSRGTDYGADRSFTTPAALPTVSTNPATELGAIAATLNGTLDADGGEVCQCGFEFGMDTGYGTITATESKTTGQTFSEVLGGLEPCTTYHFRAFATNSAGTGYGADRAFTTVPVFSRAFALSREEL